MHDRAIQKKVPKALQIWFAIHFAADIIFAIPLLIIPEIFLGFLGWQTVDPVASRLVAAALFGIGTESLLSRKNGYESFITMLNLKIIWSLAAVIGITLSIIQNAHDRAIGTWMILGIFVVFNGIWVWWRIQLPKKLID